ncbi:MAG: nicotinate phosphoribosyltransferase [Symbiobacteriia bacterium]
MAANINPRADKPRLTNRTFKHDPRIADGYYSAVYFTRAREIVAKHFPDNRVTMQIFQKNHAVICGTDEAISILREFAANGHDLVIRSLRDGDEVRPYETVMTIEGPYQSFAHLESVYLGILARRTLVATNTRRVVEAAGGKPVLFFADRFDVYNNQTGDGYAAYVSGSLGQATDAMVRWWGDKGMGTMPHSLIALCGGDTVKAAKLFAEEYPDVPLMVLVDYQNDCVGTALEVCRALPDRVKGVRLDTAGTLVDRSLHDDMGTFQPTGVNPQLVRKVRQALDAEGFGRVQIIVSGGFNADRIRLFEAEKVPVDVYAVGSSLLKGNYDYTADVVLVDGKPQAKVGRGHNPNPRLELVEP